MARSYSSKLVELFLLLHCSMAFPAEKDNHLTMSGEPTHFQVDDKAAELEINANAMGVKVNAKPASLQVVSKPGAPTIPVAHPAVFYPQLPPPYLQEPVYPSPMIIEHRRTVRRRHHFFDSDPSMGNWNFRKDTVPENEKSSEHKLSKKSQISSVKNSKAQKRQWIQQVPVLAQLVSYPLMTNIPVHPLVQQMAAFSQGAMRQSIPHLSYARQYNYAPNMPGTYADISQQVPFISPAQNVQNGELRNAIHRAIFLPAFPGNQRMFSTTTLMPLTHQSLSYGGPNMPIGPLSGFNGYYDPIISRDFVPDIGTSALRRLSSVPAPRTFIPGGMTYPSYTPLGVWQRVTKRLTIPQSPTKDKAGDKRNTLQDTQTNTKEGNLLEKNGYAKSRDKRFVREPRLDKENSPEKQGTRYDGGGQNKEIGKREFILTQPMFPQTQPVVTYVPVLTSPQIQAPAIQTMALPAGVRKSLVLNLPSKTSGTFVLNLPSHKVTPKLYSANLPGSVMSTIYKPVINPMILRNQLPSSAIMGVQRSGINMQDPGRSTGMPFTELAGIMGRPIVQNGRHLTLLYNNEQLPSQVQDQIFGSSPLEGRTAIPGLKRRRFRSRHFNRFGEMDREDEYSKDSDDNPSSYDDDRNPISRIDDEGSYTERTLPDGRTVLNKDHVGFGPITVQAKTAEVESRDQDDAIDMDLDSDKRKRIPRPAAMSSYLDKRLGIPKPEDRK